MRRFGWILLPIVILVGFEAGALCSPTVRASGWVVDLFDGFAANTDWNESNVLGGTIAFGYSDDQASVLRLAQDDGVTFPLVGREGLFNSLPAGVPWAFEIRFRFPEVTAYGVTIGMGSGSWNTDRYKESVCGQYNTSWSDALEVHQNQTIGLRIKVFRTPILQSSFPDTTWHTFRVEVQPNGTWRAFVDGILAGSGAGAFRPNLVFFGNYCHQDYAGNWTDLHVDYLRIEYFVDDTPPVTTLILNPPAPNGNNGWYRTAVQVTLSAADDASGVREIRYRVDAGPWTVYGGPFPVSADGPHTVEAYAVDSAGNTENPPKSVSFRIDQTPPTIAWSAPPPDGDNGWYRSPIPVTFTCHDGTSGIALCGPNGTITAEGTSLTLPGAAQDRAGNTASTTAGPFRRDATPPTVSGAVDPAPNAEGWNRTPVTITWTATDAFSGVAACDPPTPVTTEGANQTRSGTCRDRAGNVGTGTVTVNLDFTPPQIGGSRSPAPNPEGWNHTEVTVSWTCHDELSGIAVCPNPVVVTAEGENQSVTGTAMDRAGNEASATVAGISIDKTPPIVTFTLDPPPNPFGWHRTPVTITWSGTDALSGIARCDDPVAVSQEGADQVRQGSCRDRADNIGSAEARVSIDRTPPQITASRNPLPNPEGWVSVPVTVTFTCADALSGIAFCPNPVGVATEGANQSVSGTARDKADNLASTTLSGISIDYTPPTVQGVPDRPPDHGGWYTAPFTVTWVGSDALSGVRSCDPPVRYAGPEAAFGLLSGACEDRADHRGEASFAFRYDATPPTVTAVISPALPDGLNGWWVHPPVVWWTCEDATAGIAFCSPPVTATAEGFTTVVGRAEDHAGWRAAASAALKVDLSPPSAGLLMPASWCFPCAGPVSIGLLMADGVSGVAGWTLRLEARGLSRIFTGTVPVESVAWDGRLDGREVQPGDLVTVTLIVTDAAGHEGAVQAFLAVAAPPAPPPASTLTPTPSPMPTRTPTRVRPTPTPTRTGETPLPPSPTPEPEPPATPTPSPTPTPPLPPPASPAMVLGVVFLDRDGDGTQDPDEPGIQGAVVEAGGRTIVTGPDGRFWMPAGKKARLLRVPVRGRLTVADGVRFGVQPLARPEWLWGLGIGMVLFALPWALDPRPATIRWWTKALQARNLEKIWKFRPLNP